MASDTIQILIAVVVAYVAYQNYKINSNNSKLQKDRLRFDLFEKRYTVYRAIQEFVATVIREGRLDDLSLIKFNIDTSNNEFLFSSEITEHIKNIYKKGCDLILVGTLLDNHNLGIGEERTRLAKEKSELLLWFGDQFEASRKLFSKYLSFSIIFLDIENFWSKIKRKLKL